MKIRSATKYGAALLSSLLAIEACGSSDHAKDPHLGGAGTGGAAAGGGGIAGAASGSAGRLEAGNAGNPGGGGVGGSSAGAAGTSGAGAPSETYTTAQIHQSSKAGDNLKNVGTGTFVAQSSNVKITVSLDKPRQEVLGFGASLTEASASVLSGLGAAERAELIDSFFSPQGAHFTMARVPIGSCDFSIGSYTYAEPETADLSNFSIQKDRDDGVMQLVKDARTSAGADKLKIIASAWTAPPWMKTNGAYVAGSLKDDKYGLYAKYLVKYLQAYAAEGVDVWALTPGNEPLHTGDFETMGFTAQQEVAFIAQNLGPELAAASLETKILGYDHNKGTDLVTWATAIYGNATAKGYVAGIANHWYESTVRVDEQSLEDTHDLAPEKLLVASEQSLDSFTAPAADWWKQDAWWWLPNQGSWCAPPWCPDPVGNAKVEPVYRFAKDIILSFNHYQAGWIEWNMVLDKQGGPTHGSVCSAPVMIDTASRDIYVTPTFYAMEHFSKFILPGAHVVESSVAADSKLLVLSALNPDSSVAVVVLNTTSAAVQYQLDVAGQIVTAEIPASALQTVVLN